MQKNVGTNFIPARTEDAEGAEVIVTFNFLLYFRLSTSRFLLRTASFHAGCWHPKRGISVCAIDSRFSLARTADAEGAEVIVTFNFLLYFTLPTSRFLLRPTGFCNVYLW